MSFEAAGASIGAHGPSAHGMFGAMGLSRTGDPKAAGEGSCRELEQSALLHSRNVQMEEAINNRTWKSRA